MCEPQLLGVLYGFMGAKIRSFFEDENKQLLQLIDAELQKVQENPAQQGAPKRTLRMHRLRQARETGDSGATGAGNAAGDCAFAYDIAAIIRVYYKYII